MKHSLMESLLIDKELGNLSEQSEQLLNDYISNDMQLMELDEEISTTHQLCQKALAPEENINLPEFPAANLKSRSKTCLHKALLAKYAAVAALILIAFLVGLNLEAKSNTDSKLVANKNKSNITQKSILKTEAIPQLPKTYIENLKKLRVGRKHTKLKDDYLKMYNNFLNKNS